MPEYNAPLRDMRFVMDELLDMTGSYAAYGLEDATPDLCSRASTVDRCEHLLGKCAL